MADKKLNELGTASDANFIYAEASNGMQVRISKADLASVVARQIPSNNNMFGYEYVGTGSADTLIGRYQVPKTLSGLPSGLSSNYVFLDTIFGKTTNGCTQKLYDGDNIYSRSGTKQGTGWTAWFSEASVVAGQLGNPIGWKHIGDLRDADVIKEHGFYEISQSYKVENMPNGYAYYTLEVIRLGNSTNIIQRATNIVTSNVYVRTSGNGGTVWTSWKQCTN